MVPLTVGATYHGCKRRGARSGFTSRVWSVVLVFGILATGAPAQDLAKMRPVTLSGQVGLYAEGYTCTGIPQRKAPTSSQIYANTQFSLFGIRSGVNLLYSTDDSRLRQSMNRLAFSGEWRWVHMSLGHVSPSLAKYSLSGVTMRGGSLELTPGAFLATFAMGRSQRAVSTSSNVAFRGESYERWLYAGRIGMGRKSGTHFHLIGVLAREDIASIDDSGEVMPAENITLTPDFGFSLFGGRISLQAQVTASAFTHDTRTAVADIRGLPFSPGAVFTPRRGSRVNFAGEVLARLQLEHLSISGGYERIEPGFESLGVGHMISDQEIIRAAPQVQLLRKRLTVGASFARTRNNLLDHRLSTLTRMQYGATVQARIGRELSVNVGYQRMDNTNRPVADSLVSLFQDQIAQTVMLSPVLVLRAGTTTHTIALSAAYQTFSIELPPSVAGAGPSSDFDNVNAALNYSLALASGWSINVASTYLQSKTGVTDLDAIGVTAGSTIPFFARKLQVNLAGGWSQNWVNSSITSGNLTSSGSRQLTLNLNTTLRVTSHDSVRLSIRGLRSQLTDASGDFNELHATLRYDHRF